MYILECIFSKQLNQISYELKWNFIKLICRKDFVLFYLGVWRFFFFKPSIDKLKKCGSYFIFIKLKQVLHNINTI